MIPRIKSVIPVDGYLLRVVFDDNKTCIYDLKEDISILKPFADLKTIPGLFKQVRLDESRTCVYWNDMIDLPSDIIYEYGLQIEAEPDTNERSKGYAGRNE